MGAAKGYPWAEFRITKALSADQVTALETADLSKVTISGDNLVVAGENYASHQIRHNVRNFDISNTKNEIDVTAISDEDNRIEEGRRTWEIPFVCNVDYDENDTYDVVVKDDTGKRLIYAERQTGKGFAMVAIFTRGSLTIAREGDMSYSATVKNSTGAPKHS